MPLRDHFCPPFTDARSWDEVHGYWPAAIVQQVNKTLPEQYSAAPRVHLGAQFEIDVARHEIEPFTEVPDSQPPEGGLATAVWAPAQPTLAVETELSDFDEYEVRVYDDRKGRRLVAAIELISPANKDRPGNRSQFTSKCAALLRTGVAVVLVDVVTTHDFNLYSELLELVGEHDPGLGEQPSATYAVACRWHPRGTEWWLETWNHVLKPGQPLPCLPLWLADNFAIPLDLEASYEQTCRDLRIK